MCHERSSNSIAGRKNGMRPATAKRSTLRPCTGSLRPRPNWLQRRKSTRDPAFAKWMTEGPAQMSRAFLRCQSTSGQIRTHGRGFADDASGHMRLFEVAVMGVENDLAVEEV